MEYITTLEAAKKWNISDRRVRILCSNGQIDGTIKVGRAYMIPFDSKKPVDLRTTRYLDTEHPMKTSVSFKKIDEKRAKISNLRKLTAGEAERLREEFLIEYTYHSNSLEGNNLSLLETSMIIKEGITISDKSLKDHLEVIGHKEAYDYTFKLALNKSGFTEKIIKDIHSLVLMDKPLDRGIYRQIPVKVFGSVKETAAPEIVSAKMKELVLTYGVMKKVMHPIELAACIHLMFGAIHPFIDGNGRTGRLLLNYELLKSGYPPIYIKSSDRQRYYEAFNGYLISGSPDLLVKLMVICIDIELDKYIKHFNQEV